MEAALNAVTAPASVSADGAANFDVCVIGAGPVGLAIATELDRYGIDAVILDAGADQPGHDPGAEQGTDAMPYPDVPTTRRRGYGGTAALWGTHGNGWTNGAALFRPFEDHDFTRRPWIEHSGWPITASDLEPYYRQTCELGQLGTTQYSPDQWDPDQTKRLPLEGTGLQTAIFHMSHQDVYTKDLVGRIKSSKTVHLIGNAHVTELVANTTNSDTSNDKATISAARVAAPGGNTLEVRAKRFVLAGGGIENTRLLLELDQTSARDRPRWPVLGKMFMERPHGIAGIIIPTQRFVERAPNYQLVERQPDPNSKEPYDGTGRNVRSVWHLTPTLQLLQDEQLAAFALSFHPAEPDWLPDDMRHLANRVLKLNGYRTAAEANLHAISYMAEQYPNKDSRIELSEQVDSYGKQLPVIARQLRAEDHRLYLRMQQLAQEALTATASGQVYTRRIDAELTGSFVKPRWNGYEAEMPVAHHHMGTTRMHVDRQQGVVDADSRVHGIANLYVAGTSVFTTSSYCNPTMTAIALSLRLAEHLRRR